MLRALPCNGIKGGIVAELQGGKFGSGFVSAGLMETFSPVAGMLSDSTFARVIVISVIGGTISELSGDKFANGAGSAVFAELFNHALSDKVLRNNNYESLGDNHYARVDEYEVDSKTKAIEVHVYKGGPKFERAMLGKGLALRDYEVGIWGLDRDTEKYGWSRKHYKKAPPNLNVNQMNRLNGIVVSALRGLQMLPPPGVSGRGNANWMRGLKWMGRGAGAAGAIGLIQDNSQSRYCAVRTSDSEGCYPN